MNITIKDLIGLSAEDNMKLVRSLLTNRKPKEGRFDFGFETHGAIGIVTGINNVEFEIITHSEDISIVQHLSFEETGADHSEYINKVLEDDGFNPWLWCIVEVKATYKGLTSSAYLGGCAYNNEEEFKKGGCYEQMKEEAFNELKNIIMDIVTDFCNA
jgi:hypothetical protein